MNDVRAGGLHLMARSDYVNLQGVLLIDKAHLAVGADIGKCELSHVEVNARVDE